MMRALLCAALTLSAFPADGWAALSKMPQAVRPLPVRPISVLPVAVAAPLSASSLGDARGPSPAAAALPRLNEAAAAPAALPRGASAETSARAADFVDAPKAAANEEAAPAVSGSTSSPAPLAAAAAPREERRPQPPAPRGSSSYSAGVLAQQMTNTAMQVLLPWTMFRLAEASGMAQPAAMGLAATTVVASGWLDAAGGLLGGWLLGRRHPKTVLNVALAARAAAVAGLLVLVLGQSAVAASLLIPAAVALMMVEALGRGVADSGETALPLTMVPKGDGPALKGVLAKAKQFVAIGTGAGPVAVGALFAALAYLGGASTLALALPVVLVGAAWLAFRGVPAGPWSSAEPSSKPASGGLRGALKDFLASFKDPMVGWGIVALGLLLHPIVKGVLPPLFAEQVLGDAALSAWLIAALGAGMWAGSWLSTRLTPGSALALAAAGTLAVAAAFGLGAGFAVAAAALALFGAGNMASRVNLEAAVQSRIPAGQEGAVIASQRLFSNLAGMTLKAGVALLFWLAVPAQAFWWVAGALGAAALVQFGLSRKLRALVAAAGLTAGGVALSRAHGYPGRLIDFRGPDGAGKSTQIANLKSRLEDAGLEVVVVAANESPRFSDAFKLAKKNKELSPTTFSLSYALDLADRLDHVIVPALERGAVVIADRYDGTGVSRGLARGLDRDWLKNLVSFAPEPDAVFYFRIDADKAVDRVLARNGTKDVLDLSDEGERELVDSQGRRIKFYEAGLDMRLDPNPETNFRKFQSVVIGEYDRMERVHPYKRALGLVRHPLAAFDATQSRDAISAQVWAKASEVLGPLERYKKADERGGNSFDRDPKNDREDLKERFQDPELGLEGFLRKSHGKVLTRFAELAGRDFMGAYPVADLHGNPNVGNVARNEWGASLTDFDRAVRGPAVWDVARFLVDAFTLQRQLKLHPSVLQSFEAGYALGVRHPELGRLQQPRLLLTKKAKNEGMTVRQYVKKEKKTVRAMREHPIENAGEDPKIKALVEGYLTSVGRADILRDYHIAEAGQDQGAAIGARERERFIVLLKPHDKRDEDGDRRDWILLGLKETHADEYAQLGLPWFGDEFKTHGPRMAHASRIYSPPAQLPIGYASFEGREFYGRPMPIVNEKVERLLSREEMQDAAFFVGAQLGSGHARSLKSASPEELLARFEASFRSVVVPAAETIVREGQAAHRRYLKELRALEVKK